MVRRFGRLWRRAATMIGTLALAGAALVGATGAPAAAAGLTQVSGFGSNPGALAMYTYVPDGLPAGAPLVVALHGCGQSASDYFGHAGWQKYADLWHFALVFPQQSTANNIESCFNWYQPGDTTRGQGEAASIASMVSYAESAYSSDASQVYITGLSAGGAMTSVMLADYPDVFAGGGIMSGLPAGCASSQTEAYTCMAGSVGKTPQQWGDVVRSADPGYSGPWPRVAIWHGTADYTVNSANATEERDQWTNAWGIGQDPTSTHTLTGGTTQAIYDDSNGDPAVETFAVSGMGHGTAVDPGSGTDQCGTAGAFYLDSICSSYYTAVFWGLDQGSPGGGGLAAPTGLTSTGATDDSISLSWSGVDGAAGYLVYRDGAQVTTDPITATSYTDSGLAAGTGHDYAVAAVDSDGNAGTRSASISASTTGGGGTGQCFTANNYQQVAAGRAHHSGGYTYADGSDQNMGLYNVFVTHTLKQTGPDHYVIADGDCP